MKIKNKIITFFVIVLFGSNVNSQTKVIDSLINQIQYTTNDTLKVNLLYKIGRKYYNLSDFDNAKVYAQKSLELSEKMKFQKGLQEAHFFYANIYFRESYFETAIYHANICLKICRSRNDIESEAKCFNLLGITYRKKGEYNKALNLYFKALPIWEELGNKRKIAILLNNIGLIYYYLEKYDDALTYYNASFEISKEINYESGKSIYYNNCGLVFHNQKQYKKALEYFENSLQIEKQQNDKYGITICYVNIGDIYRALENYSKALKFYNKALQIRKEVANIYGISSVNKSIGELYFLQNNYTKANQYFIKSIERSKDIDAKDLMREAYNQISESYSMQKDYFNAYKYYKLFKEINDSIFSEENNKQILEIQTKYETEKKEKENEILKEKEEKNIEIIARKEIENKNQLLLILIVFIGLIFVSVFAYFLSRSNKHKKKSNELLLIQNEEINVQKEEIEAQRDQLEESENLIKQNNLKLKGLNATKDKLFSIIAHDLKNPFNVIFGYTDLLKESYNEFSEDKRKDFINEIDKSSKSAYQLLENLLLWALSQQGKIEIRKKEKNLKQLVAESVSPYLHSAKKKKITFTNSVPNNITVSVDKQTIKTVIANLFSNAIKFTPNNGHITINAAIIDKFVEIKISDNGVGISHKVQSKIFRIDESHSSLGTNDEKGTGLGLSLCKEFVEKNDGKIWVESEEGVGSQFYFTIPYTTYKKEITESKEIKPEVKPELQEKKLKILIAEDDKMAEKYLENVLKNISKEILFAKNGIEAIDAFSQNPDIDLVLMDIQMPEMSGYEATRKIREFNKDVIIIAETAYAISGDREKALEAGCNDYISKPIKKNRLMEMIEKYLGT